MATPDARAATSSPLPESELEPELDGDARLDVPELQRRLHDGVLQLLEFMSVGGWGSLTDPEEYRQLARRAADDLRDTVQPPTLHGTFAAAIERIVDRGAVLDPSIQWIVDIDQRCAGIDAATVEPLVLAMREAANNCVRHARASTVTIRGRCADDEVVRVDVRDDGRGIAHLGDDAGFGVRQSIISRVARAGGVVRIDAGARRGTRVHLELTRRRRLQACQQSV
jgi:signal transduction histidine kinase